MYVCVCLSVMLSLAANITLQIQTVTNQRFIQQHKKWSCCQTHTQLCKKCPQALKWVEDMMNRWKWNAKDTKVLHWLCCTSAVQPSSSLWEEAVDASADSAQMREQSSWTGGSENLSSVRETLWTGGRETLMTRHSFPGLPVGHTAAAEPCCSLWACS